VDTGNPDIDAAEMAANVSSRLLPAITAIDGFHGYLWYLTDVGFVSITLFDSDDAAHEASDAVRDRAADALPETGESLETIIARIRFASLPVLRK